MAIETAKLPTFQEGPPALIQKSRAVDPDKRRFEHKITQRIEPGKDGKFETNTPRPNRAPSSEQRLSQKEMDKILERVREERVEPFFLVPTRDGKIYSIPENYRNEKGEAYPISSIPSDDGFDQKDRLTNKQRSWLENENLQIRFIILNRNSGLIAIIKNNEIYITTARTDRQRNSGDLFTRFLIKTNIEPELFIKLIKDPYALKKLIGIFFGFRADPRYQNSSPRDFSNPNQFGG